ncbi:unnamed protein product [Peniophora sp. CBMAI 1063]|nr:unnamed protein product [Peniophora sp. CBMAI 1063]
MAPITRAALRPATFEEPIFITPSTTSKDRKKPHCRKCGMPCKGHPRGGCPTPAPILSEAQESPVSDLVDALDALNMNSDAAEVPLSVTSSTSEDSSLFKEPLRKARIRRRRGRLMPGTLSYPTDSSLVSEPPVSPPRLPPRHPLDARQRFPGINAPKEPSGPRSQSRVRSASASAREDFLDELDGVATHVPVAVYVIPASHVERLQLSASKFGFRAAAINSADGTQKDKAWLVLGTEAAAVRDVRERLAKMDASATASRGTYELAQVAGGALVGAAALLAGLAL